jgi:hypothetical protein
MYISYRIDRNDGEPIFYGPMEAKSACTGLAVRHAIKLNARLRTRLSQREEDWIHADALAARSTVESGCRLREMR